VRQADDEPRDADGAVPAVSERDGGLGVESAITARYDRLSRGQRRVIDRLLADVRYAAVISAAELAQEVGVSESTVTRAAQALGFSGYPDLQSRLRERFLSGVPERVAVSAAELGESPEGAAIRVMLEDAEHVRATAEDLNPETLRAAVELLVGARRVFVFGARGSYGLAIILGIGLRLLLPDARILAQNVGDLADQLVGLEAGDALVVISFRRVDPVTVKVLRHAVRTGAGTIAITDHLSGPLARLARLTLIARLGQLRLLPAYAPGASLVNGLLTAVALRTREAAAPRLEVVERLWREFDTHLET
jgi:DNA-binding MurR/RpiR family transcriptional regulator